MKLWSWITEWVLPLFGDIPQTELNLGNLGILTITDMLAIMFWLVLGYVLVQLLILTPYRWIRKLCKQKGV